ncbi:hypothetical protein FQN53_000117 [Emmonsiellopsis sp. PD_33]|nr:hypothetical protein FQN53_000117 [Emmonsiellopsis sp. PD_33]
MPANEVEHNYDSIHHSIRDTTPRTSLSSHLPLLPATTYIPPAPPTSPRQLSLTTNFTDLNFRRHHPTTDEASPDPREFYLQYNDPFGGDGPADLDARDMTTTSSHPRKSIPSSAGYNSNNSSPTSHRGGPPFSSRSRQNRSISSSFPKGPLFNTSRPTSVNPSAPRQQQQRQSSLRELVDKFNQNLDQVPPRPPGSLASSRAASPAPGSSKYSRSGGTHPPASKNSHEQGADHRSPARRHPRRQSQTSADLNESASRSFADLSFSRSQQPRRPLFGEIIPAHSQSGLNGRDGPSPRWRRGSDGSMHTPNPMFLDIPVDSDVAFSPTSPTAWYLGYTPALDSVNSPSRLVTHRRSRSDLTSTTSNTTIADLPSRNMGISLNPTGLQPAAAIRTRPKSNSQSRIPVSSRRLSHTSDSGGSAPSTRANSALGRHNLQVTLPPKGTSSLPKPSPKSSPSSKNNTPTHLKITSPARHKRGQQSHLTPEKSPTLNAYISAPPPKKSPPLRSSRPRQPVSSATTSASRARVADRISSLQSQSSTSSRDGRPSRQRSRRLPELGNVDFAARRQKIQQAFNKTVEENAKKAERAVQRRQLVKEQTETGEGRPTLDSPEPLRTREHVEGKRQLSSSTETPIGSPNLGDAQDAFVTPEEGRSPESIKAEQEAENAPRVTLEHDNDKGFSEMERAGEANNHLRIARSQTPSSDIAPASAVTMDTDITTFDPEPQTDSPQPSQIHRTVLSQIMQMRESSPSSSASSDSFSERDDKESIQIMLRRSRYFDDSLYNSSDNQDLCEGMDGFRSDGDRHRWSMSSWSSSIQERQSVDTPLERITETSPDTNARLSVSTAESSRTPQPWVSRPHVTTDSPPTGDPDGKATATERLKETNPLDIRYSTQMMQQYPDLAKQGGWNSKRVTQLFLQELGFEGSHLLKSDFGAATRVVTNRPSSRDNNVQKPNGLNEDPILVPDSINVPRSEYVQHRASLNLRDDWENASPSVADWMHLAASESAENSPAPGREGAETPRLSRAGSNFASVNSTVEGLGLSINVQSPQDDDSPTIPAPPLPDHSPPPVPPPGTPGLGTSGSLHPSAPSPSIYSNDPPSSILPSVPLIPAEHAAAPRSSEESSLPHTGLTPSPQTLASSATSQDRSSIDQSSVEAPAVKSSPSPEQRRLKKRKNVIKELVDTEHTFGQDMTVVVDIYKGTSSSCLDLSAEDIKTLFGNSDQVVQFSMDFQDSLKRAAKSVYVLPQSQRWQSKRSASRSTQASTTADSQATQSPEISDDEKDRKTSIGEVFMANIDRMEKVYSEYLRNHDAANKTLETLLRKKNVTIWLKECRDWALDLTAAWNLDSLLVKPVQRILKYPLLLTELLSATPPDHPDHAALTNALRETTSISVRINDMKKRADVVGQIVSGRKRKESDVRAGLSKAFGRRTEKVKTHVGMSDMFADKEFVSLSQRFGDNFFQLQLIMRDVELYTNEVQTLIKTFHEYVIAIETYITVAPSNHPELESKWCQFRLAAKEVLTVALVDHVSAVRKSVILPMITLLKLHDGPQRVMQKRNKRLMDYVRFKTLKDRGDKPDKKTIEQGEQFIALNVTLKEELPKLFALTGKLMDACLHNFVELQKTWLSMIQKRLGYILERIPEDLEQVKADWSADFSFSDAQVLSLGICNGSILADNIAGFGSPSASNGADGSSSSRRPSTVNSSNVFNPAGIRSASLEQGSSPKVSHEFSLGSAASFMQTPQTDVSTQHSNGSHVFSSGRVRTNSGFSGRISTASEMSNGQGLPSMTTLLNSGGRPNPSAGPSSSRPSEVSPSLPQLTLDTPMLQDFLADPLLAVNNNRGAPPDPALHPSSPAAPRGSFFSSAMPMAESPRAVTPTQDEEPQKDPSVLFLVASLFEFNIDRARREAGYPYLTYVAGEIFDVIGEKGDLWLARNQDDPTRQVGWIWTKHFSKLAG